MAINNKHRASDIDNQIPNETEIARGQIPVISTNSDVENVHFDETLPARTTFSRAIFSYTQTIQATYFSK